MNEFWSLYITLETIFAIGLTCWYFILPKDGLWFYPIYFVVASLMLGAACYVSVSRKKQASFTQQEKTGSEQQ